MTSTCAQCIDPRGYHQTLQRPMKTAPAEPLTITTIPCLVRVSQQQHVQRGVRKPLQLIKARKHRDLNTYSSTLQSRAVARCLPACCKIVNFQMLEQTLWTSSLPLPPALSVATHLFHYSLFTVALTLRVLSLRVLVFFFVCVSCTLLHSVTGVIMSWRKRNTLFSTLRETGRLDFFPVPQTRGINTSSLLLSKAQNTALIVTLSIKNQDHLCPCTTQKKREKKFAL